MIETYLGFSPALVQFGRGSFLHVPSLLNLLQACRPLVMVDRGVQELVQAMVSQLQSDSFDATVYVAESGEPTTTSADRAADHAREAGVDSIVAVGGGSVMDLGKAVAVLVQSDLRAAEMQLDARTLKPGLPVVCVPTTAGSGAEATRSAVLINPDRQLKRGINGPEVQAKAVVLDPSLLVSLPAKPRAAALLDATAHAVESYIGKSSSVLSAIALSGALPRLGVSLRNGLESSSPEADLESLWGSLLAGIAICNSETGAVHALAYPVTEIWGVSHGEAVGALLPQVLLAQKIEAGPALEECSALMGFEDFSQFLETCVSLQEVLDADAWIASLQADSELLERASEHALTLAGALGNAPKVWSRHDVRDLYLGLGHPIEYR